MSKNVLEELVSLAGGSIEATKTTVTVKIQEELKKSVHKLVEVSALENGERAAAARYLVRGASQEIGIIPASIHDLYIARGRGDIPVSFTVPAINLRVLSFDAARAVFRTAKSINAGALIFEIARSEIGYTDQRPSEYTTNILGAAIAEDFIGPIFLQGDHFQISPSRYADNPGQEVQAVKDLTEEAIHAGFYNIDVDTSTLVDLSKDSIPEQQEVNTRLSVEITKHIRELEPEGITISVGGEIGEVGGRNSTEEELRAYMNGYNIQLQVVGAEFAGLSKISIQTGTSHGGVVLPDGSIAEVNVDFETLLHLSQIARTEFGLAGAVQHGASTLPQNAFGKFVESEACEVHLATNFQNIFYDNAPENLVTEIHQYLNENHQNERKPDQTDDQFYYKTRKRALGPFKDKIWSLPENIKDEICLAWKNQFEQLFDSLAIKDTQDYVAKFVKAPKHLPPLNSYIKYASGDIEEEDTSDLAD